MFSNIGFKYCILPLRRSLAHPGVNFILKPAATISAKPDSLRESANLFQSPYCGITKGYSVLQLWLPNYPAWQLLISLVVDFHHRSPPLFI
jgi:hypothetical protein